jgi:2-oxoglutarate ferredoxin oxidoreductase subunit beta
MTGGQLGPTTALTARTTTSRLGNIEESLNIPYLAAASGATYIARWTILQVRQLERAITEALLKKGFSLVEAISPCPTYYGRMNRQATGLEQLRYYRDNSITKHGIDPSQVGIELNGRIMVGKFVDIERSYLPNLEDKYNGKPT